MVHERTGWQEQGTCVVEEVVFVAAADTRLRSRHLEGDGMRDCGEWRDCANEDVDGGRRSESSTAGKHQTEDGGHWRRHCCTLESDS